MFDNVICDLEIPGFNSGGNFLFQTKTFENCYDHYRIDMFGHLYRITIDGMDTYLHNGPVIFYSSFIECIAHFKDGITEKIHLLENKP